jgi:hypothetical protein
VLEYSSLWNEGRYEMASQINENKNSDPAPGIYILNGMLYVKVGRDRIGLYFVLAQKKISIRDILIKEDGWEITYSIPKKNKVQIALMKKGD